MNGAPDKRAPDSGGESDAGRRSATQSESGCPEGENPEGCHRRVVEESTSALANTQANVGVLAQELDEGPVRPVGSIPGVHLGLRAEALYLLARDPSHRIVSEDEMRAKQARAREVGDDEAVALWSRLVVTRMRERGVPTIVSMRSWVPGSYARRR